MGSSHSFCPKCLKIIPAEIRAGASGVVMDKICPDHGLFRAMISPDADTYARLSRFPRKVTPPLRHGTAVDKGCPDDCGLCSLHDQHTCLAILEITPRCDLICPVCLASAQPAGRDLSLEQVDNALRALIRQEGKATPLQLSGGEPTLHEDLGEIIRRAASLGFEKIEIDTHGLNLSRDPLLAEKLAEAGLSGIYLQMDGLTPEISRSIRGRDLVEQKVRAIENCRRSGLQVVLSVTVIPGINDASLWDMVKFGVEQQLTGVNFQPLVRSGRFPQAFAQPLGQFTLGHFLREIEQQSGQELTGGDLMPIPCPDPRCAVMSYALVYAGRLVPLSRVCAAHELIEPLANLSDWGKTIQHLRGRSSAPCGCRGACGPEEMDDLLRGSDYFSVGCHGMMDAENFDVERARRCCVHELTAEGRLVPFCLYNIKYRPSWKGC